MTELLYYKDGYLKSTEATVIEIRDGKVVLDKTIFYPECGGQPGDRGTFGEWKILDTKKDKDGTPLHVIEGDLPAVGTKSVLTLDWNHRYFYMKEHTAQHLLSALLFHEYGIGTVAVHQGEDILTIETDRSEINDDILLSLEEKAIDEVIKSRKVYQVDMDRKEAEGLKMRRSIKVDDETVKVVFISDLDAVACGGVHLSSTSEIKEICYRGKEQIRGHVRTIWSVGEKAREYRRENERAVRECGKLLSSDSHTMTSTLEKFLSEDLELKKENRELKKKVIELELIERKEDTIVFESSVSITEAPEIVEKYAEGRKIFILDGTNKRNFLFFGTKDDFEKIKKECTLKGGGREPLFRGTIMDADIERIKNILS